MLALQRLPFKTSLMTVKCEFVSEGIGDLGAFSCPCVVTGDSYPYYGDRRLGQENGMRSKGFHNFTSRRDEPSGKEDLGVSILYQ